MNRRTEKSCTFENGFSCLVLKIGLLSIDSQINQLKRTPHGLPLRYTAKIIKNTAVGDHRINWGQTIVPLLLKFRNLETISINNNVLKIVSVHLVWPKSWTMVFVGMKSGEQKSFLEIIYLRQKTIMVIMAYKRGSRSVDLFVLGQWIFFGISLLRKLPAFH